LTIQSIDATNTPQGVVTLSNSPTYVTIDSTVPHLWLPEQTCDEFAKVFGLQFDPHTQLYLVNTTVHDRLKQLNPSINFQLGTSRDPTSVVNIKLPYGAFDLEASHPIYPNATNYFPIRRAANESQFTLGRAFLQEAYLVTDYEHHNFSISQATFDSSSKERIVPIVSEDYTASTISAQNESGSQNVDPKGLSKPAIAGISVGATIFVLVCAVAFCLVWVRRRRLSKSGGSQELAERPSQDSSRTYAEFSDTAKCEMEDSCKPHELNDSSRCEAEGQAVPNEIHDTSRCELAGWETPEMAGSSPLPRVHEMSA
jgi:hypothetical protein